MLRQTEKLVTMAFSALVVCSLACGTALLGDQNIIQAENMSLENGYVLEDNEFASDGMVIKTENTSEFSAATYTFTGMTGYYDISVHYFDESDGASPLRLLVNGDLLDSWTADQDLGSASPDINTLTSHIIERVMIVQGADIRIEGKKHLGERARVDALQIVPLEAEPELPELPIVSHSAGAEEPGNEGVMSYDGDESTRWANDGSLSHALIQYGLGSIQTVAGVRIKFYKGDTRTYPIRILVDEAVVFEGETTLASGYWEQGFDPQNGQSVTIEMTGANSDGHYWLSLYEIEILGNSELDRWSILNDDIASGGRFLRWDGADSSNAPPINNHRLYSFFAPTEGLYRVYFRVRTEAGNSFWIKIDNADLSKSDNVDSRSDGWIRFDDIMQVSNWSWDRVHNADKNNALVAFYLTAGKHTLRLGFAEPQTELDQIYITNTDDDPYWAQVPNILNQIQPPIFADNDIYVTDNGAIPNDGIDDKPSFDKAIQKCLAEGCRIIVPAGRFLVNGPIHFRNNMNLHLEENATIVFSDNHMDYLPAVETRWEGTRVMNYSPLIYAYNKTNVAITGRGTLDGGEGDKWKDWADNQDADRILLRNSNNDPGDKFPEDRIFGRIECGDNPGSGNKCLLRPQMIQFYGCSNVQVEGVQIKNSSFWSLHFVFSDNITVKDVVFNDNTLKNTDGIDVDSSQYVLIDGVRFDNNDDNIAIKSGRDREGRELNIPSHKIVIRNCGFRNHNALSIGSEMSGGVSWVFAENCYALNGNDIIRGVYLKSNDDRGGKIEHVRVRHMDFGEIQLPAIELDTSYKKDPGAPSGDYPPVFSDVLIENLTATISSNANDDLHAIDLEGLWYEDIGETIVEVTLRDIMIFNAPNKIKCNNVDNLVMENIQINGEDVPSCP